jgi:hypothetical protein
MPEIGSVVRPEDAKFHKPAAGDPLWCETNWFGFTIPERRVRGYAYALFRTNLGVCRSMLQVFSRMQPHVLGMDYLRDDYHIPMPTGDLDDFALANGLRIKMTRPLEEWIVQFDDRRGNRWDLVQTALMPPVSISELGVPGSGSGYAVFNRTDEPGATLTGHIDQTMHVQGEVVIGGRAMTVDFPSNRDHSWSPRREYGHNLMGCFDEAHFGRHRSFLMQTRNDELERGVVTHGYLREGREVIPFKAGVGRYRFDNWIITALEYELEDARGRTHVLRGEPVSITESYQVNAFACYGMVRWSLAGEVGWGDFKWHWDVQKMQAAVREGRFKL